MHYLQLADLEPGNGEVGDLEFYVDWLLPELLAVRRDDGWQLELRVEEEFPKY